MGENFNQRSPDGGTRNKQAKETSCESEVTVFLAPATGQQALRQQASQAAAHTSSSPPPEQAAQQSRTQPRCQKAALKLHILLQRRHTSPPDPRETLENLPKACSLTPSCHRHVSHQHQDWTQISYDFTAFSEKTQSLWM